MISRILERFYNIDPQEMMTEEQRNVLNYCTEIVQEVAKEYGNGWIPCSERLPDTSNWDASTIGKLFLVSYEPDPVSKLWVGIRYFNKGTNKFGGDEKVIAWQPLPTPYQKGE